MNHYHDLEHNKRSWFYLLQDALPDARRVQSTLHLLKHYCQHHNIKLRVDASQNFLAESQDKRDALSHAICQSLHYSSLGAGCAELVAFINGQTKQDITTLAMKIMNNAAVYNDEEKARIDLSLRQEMQIEASTKKMDLKLFQPIHYKTGYREVLAEAKEYHTVSRSEYKVAVWRILLAAHMRSHLRWAMARTIEDYYIAELNLLQDTSKSSQVLIRMMSAISWVQHHNKPAFLIPQAYEHGVVLAFTLKKNQVVVHPMTVGDQREAQNEFSNLLDQIEKLPGIRLEKQPVKIASYDRSEFAEIALISAFLEAYENNKLRPNAIRELYLNHIFQLERHGTMRHWQHAVIREEKHSKSEKAATRRKAAPKLATAGQQQNMAYDIFLLMKHYRPSMYDIFGYDFSGSRNKLLTDILNYLNMTNSDRAYQEYVLHLMRARKRSSLYQDLLFGVFIDQILEEAQIERSVGLAALHPCLSSIAKASELKYREQKQMAAMHNIHYFASMVHADLLRNLHAVLCQKKSANLLRDIKRSVNIWLATEHQVGLNFATAAQKKLFDHELNSIVLDLCESLSAYEAQVKNVNDALHFSLNTDDDNLQHIGALVGTVCYQLAHLEVFLSKHADRQHENEQRFIFPLYQRYVNMLPAATKQLHNGYMQEKKLQTQAKRAIKVLQGYRLFPLRRDHTRRAMCDKLLNLANDASFHSMFAEHLRKLIYQHVSADGAVHSRWNWPPEKLMAREEFAAFLQHIFEVTGESHHTTKLHPELRRILG